MTPLSPLSRTDFKTRVLERDGHRCVKCNRSLNDGVRLDAHHILERRLWPDGGYHLDNGATLCDDGEQGCHWQAETTQLSVEEIRSLCGISRPLLPPDLYPDTPVDKWGNPILDDGRRARGPLFDDPSVQKILTDHLHLFTDRVKYGRTWHLPWSPGATSDDRIWKDCSPFIGREVVVTRKMDGEHFTGYADGASHARAIDGAPHPSRSWARAFWGRRAHDLPAGWRLCGENLYAVHALHYTDLPGYLMGYSLWDEHNRCLPWDDTVTWLELLDVPSVPVLWRGIWDERAVRALHGPRDDATHEGYVVRLADGFDYIQFPRSLAKYVRAGHVGPGQHWRHRPVQAINGLASDAPRF